MLVIDSHAHPPRKGVLGIDSRPRKIPKSKEDIEKIFIEDVNEIITEMDQYQVDTKVMLAMPPDAEREFHYGEYISAVLRDIPAVIVPLERIARNPYLNQILLNLSTIDSKNDEQYIDLSKGNSLARYFFTVNYLLEKRILGEKSQCFLKEIGEFNDLIKGLKIIILLRNGKIELKDDVEKIKDFFETKGNVYQFLDKPHSNLFFDIILNQLSYPLHNNVLHNARYQYVAKSNLMFTDVSIYDECRYIYEWLPGLHQIISSFRDKSWQYVFRFALDGLVKMRQSYNNEFFFQGAIISNSIDEFSSKKLKERVQIK